jgi:hypothetical protein
MTLRRRSKAIENLRLANIHDFTITEETPDLCSPRSLGFVRSDLLPRRVDGDTSENIAAAFQNFTWVRPKIDGTVLYDYRRFTNDMVVPTAGAIEPWVGWLQAQFGWDREWIMENPVATKREVMRRFEGREERREELVVVKRPNRRLGNKDLQVLQVHECERRESMEKMRRGAVSRFGFRDDDSEDPLLSISPSRMSRTDLSEPLEGRKGSVASDDDGRDSPILIRRKVMTARPASALGFRQMKALKVGFSSLKKKALTNPWQRRSKTARK